MELNKIYQGDALSVLKAFPKEIIDCVMCSPPYWALRDYGVDGQLGLEPTFDEYIDNLCDIFEEVRRVLKRSGTCWVNLGDTYGGSGKGAGSNVGQKESWNFNKKPKVYEDVPQKSLTMVPFRFAIEMVNRGWILRNTIIWHKRNCMPSSAKDRFTVDFEYLFFFVKSKRYWFEQQLEPTITKDSIIRDRDTTKLNNVPGRTKMGGLIKNDYDEKNKRATWQINPKPFSQAHFAVYPEELCETPLKAGCPKGGAVLDPFMGSGTTAVVAKRQKKNYVGIELSPDYIEIAEKRLKGFKNWHFKMDKLNAKLTQFN